MCECGWIVEMVEMVEMVGNGWKWLEMVGGCVC